MNSFNVNATTVDITRKPAMASRPASNDPVASFIGGLINYVDRSALSIAAPQVSHDLELSPSQMGAAHQERRRRSMDDDRAWSIHAIRLLTRS